MSYTADFRPFELLCPDGVWRAGGIQPDVSDSAGDPAHRSASHSSRLLYKLSSYAMLYSMSSRVAADTRTTILDAARALFEAEPYTSVGMEAVAKRAGVSRQAIYLHFASKADLLTALGFSTATG